MSEGQERKEEEREKGEVVKSEVDPRTTTTVSSLRSAVDSGSRTLRVRDVCEGVSSRRGEGRGD